MLSLKRGNRGDDVRRLQALLCLCGHDAKPIDGDFGSGTERALLAYQAARRPGGGGRAAGGSLPPARHGPARSDQDAGAGDRPGHARPRVARSFPDAPRANVERYLPDVLAALAEAGLDDRDMVLMALGTIRAESARFEPIDERVSKYNTDPGMHPFNRYDDRKRLGNRGRPDGERYKGRGFIQLTGRANYRTYGERLGLGTRLEDEPQLANDSRIAAQILAAFLKDRQSAAKYAILGQDLATARKLVNGGSHGLERFAAAFDTGARLLA